MTWNQYILEDISPIVNTLDKISPFVNTLEGIPRFVNICRRFHHLWTFRGDSTICEHFL